MTKRAQNILKGFKTKRESKLIDWAQMVGKRCIWDCSHSRGFNHLVGYAAKVLKVTKHRIQIETIPPKDHPSCPSYIRYVSPKNLKPDGK